MILHSNYWHLIYTVMVNLQITDDFVIYVSEDLNPDQPLALNGQQFVRQISGIKNLTHFDWFSDVVEGENDMNKLKREWRLSLDGVNWSEWFLLVSTDVGVDYNNDTFYDEIGSVKLEEQTPLKKYKFDGVDFDQLDHSLTYYLEIRWTKDSSLPEILTIKSYEVRGCWNRQTSYNPLNILGSSSDYFYFRPGQLLKVFSIRDFNIEIDGLTTNRTISVDYRFSQDSGRSWTTWETLTTENISTANFSRVKFFLPEFRIKRTGDTGGTIALYNIELIGDIQNVSNDYLKVNKLGLRECCCIVDANGNELEKIVNNLDITGGGTMSGSNILGGSGNLLMGLDNCSLPDVFKYPLSQDNLDNLFKPYELNKAVELYSSLSNISSQLFGFDVTYFSTDADFNGQDHTFHEYQLFNVVCVSDIKVTVDENNFPDNQIVFNPFDLSLFESFEIQITKDNFHKAFGISRRPSKEDFLWFCQLNRMYQVEHSQVKRDFNNSGVYYRVILKKYSQKSNVLPANTSIEDRLNALKRNSTLDELMGVEKQADKLNVANKEQHRTLTHDRVRDKIYSVIDREFIDNSSLIVSKDHYDLSSITYSNVAVVYNSDDASLKKSENRAVMAWFNVNNFYEPVKQFVVVTVSVVGLTGPTNSLTYSYNATHSVVTYSYIPQRINLINNYDDSINYGYDISLNNVNTFDVRLNSYTFSMTASLTNSVWYCYLTNINQRAGTVEQYLYKRNTLLESDAAKIRSSKLQLLSYTSSTLPETQEFMLDYDMRIFASDTKLTNIRVFNDIVPEEVHNKVLNQQIVRDASYLILADNANKIMKANNYPYN